MQVLSSALSHRLKPSLFTNCNRRNSRDSNTSMGVSPTNNKYINNYCLHTCKAKIIHVRNITLTTEFGEKRADKLKTSLKETTETQVQGEKKVGKET